MSDETPAYGSSNEESDDAWHGRGDDDNQQPIRWRRPSNWPAEPQFPSRRLANAVQPRPQNIPLHIFLFVAALITTTMAGVVWVGLDPFDLNNWFLGLTYGLLVMTIITAHEFGHYFAARHHGIDSTLPYFIPFPILPFFGLTTALLNPFGTMGAVIRTRSPFENRRALFDVGVAGPLAGFVMCVIILAVGFMTLPPKEYIYTIHPEYLQQFGGAIPTTGMFFSEIGLYSMFEFLFAAGDAWVPPMNEMYHYPLLCAGWFGLFLTGLNLIPVGQLDGGHIAYAMFGARVQSILARVCWWLLLTLGIFGFLNFGLEVMLIDPAFRIDWLMEALLGWRSVFPWLFDSFPGWLFWALVIKFVIRLDHPFVAQHRPLTKNRNIVGWLAFAIFLLTFAPKGIYNVVDDFGPMNLQDPDAIYTRIDRY
jgi:membrane-associated protease RseP (regulator of RpoE activity)